MLFYWFFFLYHIGTTGEPWTSMTVVGRFSCAHFSRVGLSVYLMVLTFSYQVGLGCQPWNLCGVTWDESFSRLFVSPGVPVGRGLFQRPSPTSVVALWSDVPSPCIPVAPVCGLHQSNANPTLGVSTHPRVGLMPLCCEAAFWGIHHLHIQYLINWGNEG